MYFREGQDNFPNDLALGSWQLNEGFEGFTLQVARAFVPTLPQRQRSIATRLHHQTPLQTRKT